MPIYLSGHIKKNVFSNKQEAHHALPTMQRSDDSQISYWSSDPVFHTELQSLQICNFLSRAVQQRRLTADTPCLCWIFNEQLQVAP